MFQVIITGQITCDNQNIKGKQEKERSGVIMNDWNGNGRYDSQDSFIDYHGANSGNSGVSSDWWKFVLLAIVMGVCPVLGIVIVLGILLFGK